MPPRAIDPTFAQAYSRWPKQTPFAPATLPHLLFLGPLPRTELLAVPRTGVRRLERISLTLSGGIIATVCRSIVPDFKRDGSLPASWLSCASPAVSAGRDAIIQYIYTVGSRSAG